MGRYGVPVLGLAIGGILLYASIENCGWVLSAEPAQYCGASPVAWFAQVLGAGVGVGAASALVLVWLGADTAVRAWYERIIGRRFSTPKGTEDGDSGEVLNG